jgi:hypothetical protein
MYSQFQNMVNLRLAKAGTRRLNEDYLLYSGMWRHVVFTSIRSYIDEDLPDYTVSNVV